MKQRSERPSAFALVAIALGVTAMGYGVWGALDNEGRTHPVELAGWVVGADLAHDLLLAPLVAGVSWLVARSIPAIGQHPVRWALATSGVLCLIAWPFVRGYGRNASVPSLLDRNYAVGLSVYVGIVWAIAGLWLLRNWRAARGDTSDQSSSLTP